MQYLFLVGVCAGIVAMEVGRYAYDAFREWQYDRAAQRELRALLDAEIARPALPSVPAPVTLLDQLETRKWPCWYGETWGVQAGYQRVGAA